ncbi:DUF3108 domain-containing protein [Hahella ganghwensis]|uniref:DUF3108 domain-containing protein n=1 Tax=Hahella ganghwensis TaxID=286420 RepID=UPI000379D039|nr:DUF3108 domain-containing protein [Hahella ganghwensis]
MGSRSIRTTAPPLTGWRLLPAALFSLVLTSLHTQAETTDSAHPSPPSEGQHILLATRAEYRASYKKGVPIRGSAIRTLEKLENGDWQYRFDVSSFIVDISETLHFQWNDSQLLPIKYNYERSGWVKSKQSNASFDWQSKQVRYDINNDSRTISIPPLTLDRLGYQLQLRLDLARGKEEMHYTVADKGRLREFVFAVTGEESLQGENSSFPCVVVEKIREPDSSRQTKLWFAQQQGYLLVKMSQVEPDGEKYQIVLQKAQVGDQIFEPRIK